MHNYRICSTCRFCTEEYNRVLRGQGAANCTTNGSPCFISILSSAADAASDLSVTWRDMRKEGEGGREGGIDGRDGGGREEEGMERREGREGGREGRNMQLA